MNRRGLLKAIGAGIAAAGTGVLALALPKAQPKRRLERIESEYQIICKNRAASIDPVTLATADIKKDEYGWFWVGGVEPKWVGLDDMKPDDYADVDVMLTRKGGVTA